MAEKRTRKRKGSAEEVPEPKGGNAKVIIISVAVAALMLGLGLGAGLYFGGMFAPEPETPWLRAKSLRSKRHLRRMIGTTSTPVSARF